MIADWASALTVLADTDFGPSKEIQSALYSSGPQAAHIQRLWWIFVAFTAVTYLLTLAFLLGSLWRARKSGVSRHERLVLPQDPARDRRITKVVGVSVAATLVVLAILLLNDFFVGRSLAAAIDDNPIKIKVTAKQWWWGVEYQTDDPSQIIRTANEIHIPIGRAVRFELQSSDVIHSFWVPSLHGKKDVIPGYTTELWVRADAVGLYRGQCAEYCGSAHAKMRFLVIAETPENFEKWCAAQRQPAKEPETDSQKRGRDVFLSTTCAMCHSIQGTDAFAAFGPNLTHVGSRLTIAGATLSNKRGHLGGWILDPQHVKPGSKMPQHNLAPEDLRALLDYLESLK